jgi:hypothetical protein
MSALQEASILNPLRVMVINDMLYLIHVQGLAEHVSPNARSQHQLAFVDLEKSCCEVFTFTDHTSLLLVYLPCFTLLTCLMVQLLANTEKNEIMMELLSIQGRFSATFPVEDVEPGTTKQKSRLPGATDLECTGGIADTTSLVVDLSAFLESTQIALPSLNG